MLIGNIEMMIQRHGFSFMIVLLMINLLIFPPVHRAHSARFDPCPYDQDGDGLDDCTDDCDYDYAPNSPNGCSDNPGAAASDRDGDGTPDWQDQCPDSGGPAWLQGCPPAPTEATASPLLVPVVLPEISSSVTCVGATRTAQAVNVRANPSTSSSIVGALDFSEVYPLASAVQVDGERWYALPEPLGFVADWVLRHHACGDNIPTLGIDMTTEQGLLLRVSLPQLATIEVELKELMQQIEWEQQNENAVNDVIARQREEAEARWKLSAKIEQGEMVFDILYQAGMGTPEAVGETLHARVHLPDEGEDAPCQDAATPCLPVVASMQRAADVCALDTASCSAAGVVAACAAVPAESTTQVSLCSQQPFVLADRDADGRLSFGDLPRSDPNTLDLWVSALDADAAAQVSAYLFADLDGDGTPDLIAFSWGTPDSNGLLSLLNFSALDADGNGTLDADEIPILNADAFDPAQAGLVKRFIVADFNGDGALEATFIGEAAASS